MLRHIATILFSIILASTWLNAPAQILVSELLASNQSVITDPDYGKTADWIELYNAGNEAVDIKGYFFTDDKDSLYKWQVKTSTVIAPNQYFLIWADGTSNAMHTNFKISSAGEYFAMLDPKGTILMQTKLPHQFPDVSYGIDLSNPNQFGYIETPTPGSTNNQPLPEYVASTPRFLTKGGIFEESITVSLTAIPSVEVRYTTDGSAPNSQSTLYSNPIQITSTTVIRACCFKKNALPGPIITNTYFIHNKTEGHSLPIISIAGNPDDFWHAETGIYVQDFKPDWEIPINIELFENDGSDRAAFNIQAGTKVNGLWSWQLPQKMLGIYFRKQYGEDALEYPLFMGSNRYSFSSFALRASGSDWSYTIFRDILGQHAIKDNSSLGIMQYRPAVVYINGQYMGIHNIREKVDDDYVVQNYSKEAGTFDMVENQNYAEAGSVDEYQQVLDIAETDLSVQANFDKLANIIDVENLTDFFTTEVFVRNTSVGHNVMAWKPHGTGKWKWIVMDLDRGFFSSQDKLISWFANQDVYPIQAMLKNEGYQQYLGKRMASHLYTTFDPDRMNMLIEEHASLIDNEIPRHLQRWEGTTSNYGNAIPSKYYWESSVDKLSIFCKARVDAIFNDLTNYGFDIPIDITIKNDPETGGNCTFNGLPIPFQNHTGKYLKNIEFTLVANAKPGYQFAGWINAETGAQLSTNPKYSTSAQEAISITAKYKQTGQCILPDQIDEDITLTKSCSPYAALGDVFIHDSAIVTIEAGVEIQMPENASIFVNGAISAIGNATDPITFTAGQEKPWGVIVLKNTTSPSTFAHVTIEKSSKGPNTITQSAAISAFNASVNIDHATIIDVEGNPVSARYSDVVMTNSTLRSKITGDLINVKYGTARVENCTFTGNTMPDTDAIDYDDITDGIIKNVSITGFYGFNSDAIDIGEEATNIRIDSVYIHDITDKGISVGQWSTAHVSNSTFVNCNLGLGLKDSCYMSVDNCTFYNNAIGIACFEKKIGRAGGNATVTDCIISNSSQASIFADSASTLTISNSISDTDTLTEEFGNIWLDPQFISPEYANFTLQNTSPIYGKNIGSPLQTSSKHRNVAISELYIDYYNTRLPEFIGIKNFNAEPVDISNYSVTKGIQATIPSGTIIQPNEQIYITSNIYSYFWQDSTCQIFQWSKGKLANYGEEINLVSNFGIEIDHLTYRNNSTWPEGLFSAIQAASMTHPYADNHFGKHWKAFTIDTTGYANNPDATSGTGPTAIIEAEEKPEIMVYPIPAQDNITIVFDAFAGVHYQITTMAGSIVSKGVLNDSGKETIPLPESKGILFLQIEDYSIPIPRL